MRPAVQTLCREAKKRNGQQHLLLAVLLHFADQRTLITPRLPVPATVSTTTAVKPTTASAVEPATTATTVEAAAPVGYSTAMKPTTN
jgi:hypothetical protein